MTWPMVNQMGDYLGAPNPTMSSFRAETGSSKGKWKLCSVRGASLLLKWRGHSHLGAGSSPWQAAQKWGC